MSLISYSIIIIKSTNSLPVSKDESPMHAYQFPKYAYTPNNDISTPVIALSLSGREGEPLFCHKCKSTKLERTHHCKECQQCMPKMDHHCLWINGCVHEGNYKYFFLFVFYAALYASWGGFNVIRLLLKAIKSRIGDITLDFCWRLYKVYLASIYHFWKNITFMIWYRRWIPLFTGVPSLGLDGICVHWYILSFFGFLFGSMLTGFAAVHLYYIIHNLTSIEYIANRPTYVRADFDPSGRNFEVVALEKYVTNMYDLGFYQNWCSVMGENPLVWFVPIRNGSPDENLFKKTFVYNSKFTKHILSCAQVQRDAQSNDGDSGLLTK